MFLLLVLCCGYCWIWRLLDDTFCRIADRNLFGGFICYLFFLDYVTILLFFFHLFIITDKKYVIGSCFLHHTLLLAWNFISLCDNEHWLLLNLLAYVFTLLGFSSDLIILSKSKIKKEKERAKSIGKIEYVNINKSNKSFLFFIQFMQVYVFFIQFTQVGVKYYETHMVLLSE